MLIELVVSNFRSIRDRQVFSLVSSKSTELEDNCFTPSAPASMPLLRSAAIYGANAAGKSNFIKALRAMKEIVKDSAKNMQRDDPLPLHSFRLSDEFVDKPSEFEVLFISDGVKYQYGFSATSERVLEEWLYAYPKSRPQRWFIRAYNRSEEKYEWDFSPFFLGQKQLWKESTRNNALFLSTAIILNSEQLKPVYDWFTDTLRVASVSGWNLGYTAELCSKDEEKNEVLNFLKSADLDIVDLKVEPKLIDGSIFPKDMPEEIKKQIIKELKGAKVLDVKTVHKTDSGKEVLFDLEDESDGTQKIFSFAGPWIDTLKNGRVLFIDELHDSLHPKIVQHLVSLFNNKKTNKNNAQLVFTTHETSILDQHVFRRDQIWFCKKQIDQSSIIYPLSDFSPRKGTENLEKAYLAGRYGALPLISNIWLSEEA